MPRKTNVPNLLRTIDHCRDLLEKQLGIANLILKSYDPKRADERELKAFKYFVDDFEQQLAELIDVYFEETKHSGSSSPSSRTPSKSKTPKKKASPPKRRTDVRSVNEAIRLVLTDHTDPLLAREIAERVQRHRPGTTSSQVDRALGQMRDELHVTGKRRNFFYQLRALEGDVGDPGRAPERDFSKTRLGDPKPRLEGKEGTAEN